MLRKHGARAWCSGSARCPIEVKARICQTPSHEMRSKIAQSAYVLVKVSIRLMPDDESQPDRPGFSVVVCSNYAIPLSKVSRTVLKRFFEWIELCVLDVSQHTAEFRCRRFGKLPDGWYQQTSYFFLMCCLNLEEMY